MAERTPRKAIRIEEDLYYKAVTLAGKTRDGNPTALCRRLLREELEMWAEKERAEQ